MRDDPSLVNLPIAIGGKSDRRGVVATCNYKARQFGVRSAMPTGQALKLCPDLVVIPGTMAKYREAALQIRQIFYRYMPMAAALAKETGALAIVDVLSAGVAVGTGGVTSLPLVQNLEYHLAVVAQNAGTLSRHGQELAGIIAKRLDRIRC